MKNKDVVFIVYVVVIIILCFSLKDLIRSDILIMLTFLPLLILKYTNIKFRGWLEKKFRE